MSANAARSSHRIRKVQRRPSRSSRVMIGRPDFEPRTLCFFMADIGFGVRASLRHATDNVAWLLRLL